ncbi:endonuclease 8-like 3 [Paramuricea clavata]|uniref:Endonuclease 8-like 3 n=1 Tax=Paramuricea clavata TaxID=317549 RepID=A0A7D9DH39_PARCT|nr:endonuclease 8-like 3 [Paramuricea clavata]
MKCLHGKSASTSTTSNGSFWFCGQNPSCHFFCSEEDGYRFEKAIIAWKSAGAHQPQCHEHQKLARMRIVKDPMKEDYGRPFFVCSHRENPCSFWQWGDVAETVRPNCRHGFPCCIRKVKKEGLNKDRTFFCCPNGKDNSCSYFEWTPSEEDIPVCPCFEVNFSMPPSYNYTIKRTGERFTSRCGDRMKAFKEHLENKSKDNLTNAFENMKL